MRIADRIRARAHAAIARAPGALGDKLRGLNEVLGRPLADADELADRRAFAARRAEAQAAAQAAAAQEAPTREAAPVIVYYMSRQKDDVGKLTEILEANKIAYTVTDIQDDPAAQYAVRRDSRGKRLPVVFVAGECVGGRIELAYLARSGELAKKVFG